MGRIVIAIIAVVASFMLADSLICNKCSVGLFGVCLNSAEETCSTNTSVCFTARACFPDVTDFVGFNTQGCREGGDGCNSTTNGTLLGVLYQVKSVCCDTDKCNPVSGAPSARLSLTAALGAAVVASVWGSVWL